MFKKAQAAMEFLMTYGWAILVVLAAIGALAYFGVLSPGNLLPQKCEFSAGLDCTETPSASQASGQIEFPLTNSNGYKIHPLGTTKTNPEGFSGCTGQQFLQGGAPVDEILNGDNFIVRLTGCTNLISGERYSTDVTVQFRSNSTGMQHNTVGRLVGKAGP
jgi:hypothetical protein